MRAETYRKLMARGEGEILILGRPMTQGKDIKKEYYRREMTMTEFQAATGAVRERLLLLQQKGYLHIVETPAKAMGKIHS
jgi:hypothetical protein